MAQRSATVRVDGQVVKSERKHGTFEDRNDPDRKVEYDFIESRVITPEYDAIEVRFPSDGSIPVPARDKVVALTCEARPSGGNLKLTVLAVAPSDAVVSTR